MYIMAPELISSVCVCMCIFLLIARQRLGRHVPVATNACNNRRILGGIIFKVIATLRPTTSRSVRLDVEPIWVS
jgi:hypothetical protein